MSTVVWVPALEVVTKRGYLVKNDTGCRPVSKYETRAVHLDTYTTRGIRILQFEMYLASITDDCG